MRDILLVPLVMPMIAQTLPVQSEWERIGITGLSIMVTIFIWRYFTGIQNVKDKENIVERERLLKEGNAKTQQVIDLLKAQLEEQRAVSSGAKSNSTILKNTTSHPVPVQEVRPE